VAVPSPDLQLLITPPGGAETDYTRYLSYVDAQQSMTITQNFGRQGDTAVFPLVVEHDGALPWVIPVMSQVRLHDTRVGQTLFGGVVTAPSLAVIGPNLAEWDLNCTDYTVYANSAVVRFPASGTTASDQIVVDITRSAKCGISAARTADGGYVAPGPDLPDWTLGYTTLTSAWKALASAMGQVVPYGWYVDDQRQLHFYDQNTALDSRVTFTTSPATAGSITEGHILLDSEFRYEWDGSSIRNRVLVQGATQRIPYSLKGSPTDRFRADGYSTSWPLRYTVSSSSSDATYAAAAKRSASSSSQPVVLFADGAYTQVKVIGATVPAGGWNIVSNGAKGYFLVAASPPPAGALIEIWYTYETPLTAQATDTASVAAYPGPNGGVFAEFISDSSLASAASALARAQADRLEYAFAVERITFNTSPDFLGWVRAGYTFGLKCGLVPDSQRRWAMGIDDVYLCTGNAVTFGSGGYRTCQVTAIRT
jgi:hypothetical protein